MCAALSARLELVEKEKNTLNSLVCVYFCVCVFFVLCVYVTYIL